MASERVGASSWLAAQASRVAINSSEIRGR
jgi:hypothetical protein